MAGTDLKVSDRLAARFAVALVVSCALLVCVAPAGAAIPEGNLLANGDGEAGIAVTDGTSHYCPQSWECPGNAENGTLARYGSVDFFPSEAESARIGGGKNFFLGGPNNAEAVSSQFVDLSAAAPEIDAGQVQYTLGGCFGGKADDPDYTKVYIYFWRDYPPTGFSIKSPVVTGAGPAERANQTKLLPASGGAAVPPGARFAQFSVEMTRLNGIYNDGNADNLGFILGPIPGPAPETSSCLVPGAGTGTGTGDGSGGGGGTSNLTSGVLAFGDTAKVGSDGKARIRVRCNTVEVKRCKGTLSVSLAKASEGAAKKKVKLGSARYSIASGKRATVKVPLRKSDAKTVAELSSSDLKKRRLKVKTKTKVGTAKLKQTVLLKIKRSR